MLTRSGFWLLAVLLAAYVLGILAGSTGMMLLGASGLTWFCVEGLLFALSCHFASTRMRLARRLDMRPADRASVWAGRPITVEVLLNNPSPLGLAIVELSDLIPAASKGADPTQTSGPCDRENPLRLRYQMTCQSPGILRFEGVKLNISDRQGLWHFSFFVQSPSEVVAFPEMSSEGDPVVSQKRRNALVTQGIHRFKRPGSGSELLDLRDYIPGDPPKTIAWKVSARRDKLITKEYESEVPVQCTVFLDVSDSVCVGRVGETAVIHSANIASGLVRDLVAHRDPVGLCCFDEHGADLIRPGIGNRQLMRIQARLARAAAQSAKPSECPANDLVRTAYRFCETVYPELLDPGLNHPGPWWVRLWRSRRSGLMLFATWIAALSFIIGVSFLILATSVWGVLGVFLLIASLAVYWYIARRKRRKTPRRLIDYGMRKQLSAVLAARHRLGPGGVSLLTNDDRRFSIAVQQWLSEHRVPYERPFYGSTGRFLFSAKGKLAVLSGHLMRAIAHGRDNEMFVLMVDLLEIVDSAGELFSAVKVAHARHHQLLVVCPWPAGLPLPTSPDWPDDALTATDPLQRRFQDARLALRQLDLIRYRNAYLHVQAELSRAGVPFICASVSASVREILRRIERIRAAGTSIRFRAPAGR